MPMFRARAAAAAQSIGADVPRFTHEVISGL
jgi:hypothetical protein